MDSAPAGQYVDHSATFFARRPLQFSTAVHICISNHPEGIDGVEIAKKIRGYSSPKEFADALTVVQQRGLARVTSRVNRNKTVTMTFYSNIRKGSKVPDLGPLPGKAAAVDFGANAGNQLAEF